jgi:RNA polymerase sigma-70 factor (ECF subfamily)
VNGAPRSASNGADGNGNGTGTPADDGELVAAAQRGDKAAFRTLVERYQRRAFGVALALVRDEQDAREVVQEAFLRAYRNLSKFKGDSAFFTWLYRIVTNLSIDLTRRPGRRTVELDLDSMSEAEDLDVPTMGIPHATDPADMLRRGELGARLQAAFDALPSYHRAVIVLREIEGLSYEEMGQSLGVSKGTIMSRLFHARLKLQRALGDLYQEQFGAAPSPRDAGDDRAPTEPTDAGADG